LDQPSALVLFAEDIETMAASNKAESDERVEASSWGSVTRQKTIMAVALYLQKFPIS